MTIGERIKHYRIRRGLSQSELARQAQIGQSTLHGYESGTRPAGGMSVDIAKRLARALGITVDHLVGAYEEDDVGSERWTAAVAEVLEHCTTAAEVCLVTQAHRHYSRTP